MNISDITPDTVAQWTVAITALAGTVGLVGSALANVLPKQWPITQTLTQLFADLRAVRTPDEPPEPQQSELAPLPPPMPRGLRPPPPPRV